MFGICFALLVDRAGSHWASCLPTPPNPCLQGCSLDYPLSNILLSLRKRITDGSTAQTQRQPQLYLEMMGNLEKHVCYTRERDLSWLQTTALAARQTKISLDLVISCPKTFPLILLHSLEEKADIYGNLHELLFSRATENQICFWFCMLQDAAIEFYWKNLATL